MRAPRAGKKKKKNWSSSKTGANWSSVPSEMKVPSTVEDTLKSFSGQELLFPTVLQVLKLLLVTPVTTTSVECVDSALVFVKSDHRNTMSEGRMHCCACMSTRTYNWILKKW